jgi:hypothetical protein
MHSRSKIVQLGWFLAAALLTGAPAFSQMAPAPAAQPVAPVPPPGGPDAKPEPDCNSDKMPDNAGGASVVQATGQGLQQKSWQPMGGEIQFTVSSFAVIPADASMYVCFRWKTRGGKEPFVRQTQAAFDLSSDRKSVKVTTTVPRLPQDTAEPVEKVLPLVPLADVRILAVDNNKKSIAADASTIIGITYPLAAFFFAILAMALGLVVLYFALARRVHHPGINKANWLLRVISTPAGIASLSQLQIIIWTFVVAASAVYVMSLSGRLIEVTSGTLILLGIAGAAGLGAKVHTEAQTASAEKAAIDAQAVNASNASALRAKADAMKTAPANKTPKWSDLIVNDNGSGTPEVDVTRFQMLFFTIVTAIFVLITVVATYVIPEIPGGFVTLMGISNGVYIGSKVATNS